MNNGNGDGKVGNHFIMLAFPRAPSRLRVQNFVFGNTFYTRFIQAYSDPFLMAFQLASRLVVHSYFPQSVCSFGPYPILQTKMFMAVAKSAPIHAEPFVVSLSQLIPTSAYKTLWRAEYRWLWTPKSGLGKSSVTLRSCSRQGALRNSAPAGRTFRRPS
jgi:hypothetical protein